MKRGIIDKGKINRADQWTVNRGKKRNNKRIQWNPINITKMAKNYWV